MFRAMLRVNPHYRTDHHDHSPARSRARIALLLLLSVVMLATTFTSRPAYGQEATTSNPRIIGSTPAQREIVGPDASIQITFDQAMDRASVESAIVTTPQIAGKVTWADDTRFTFTPDSALTRGTEYTLQIGDGARSKPGQALEERFRLTFQVASFLTVTQTVPENDTREVRTDAVITVVFDSPVVPLVNTADQANLPSPITVTPAVKGSGKWLSTSIYTFTPETAFAGGTVYTITFDATLKNVDGVPLADESAKKQVRFTTINPQLASITPYADSQGNALESNIVLTFNQPMNVESVRAATTVTNLSNGNPVAGTLVANADLTVFTFAPSSRLTLETQYRVTVTGAAKSQSGDAALTNPSGSQFTTAPYPRIVTSYPANNETVGAGSGVQIQFNTIIDPKTAAEKITIDPKPSTPVQVSPSGNYLYINFQTDPGAQYTVTIAPGIQDLYGNTITEPYTFTFYTSNADPMIDIARRDYSIGVTSAYRPAVALAAAGVGVNTVEVSITSLTTSQALALPISSGYLDINRVGESNLPVTRSFTILTNAEKNRRFNLNISLGDSSSPLAPGAYYIQLDSPETRATQYRRDPIKYVLIVSEVQLVVKTAESGFSVWATDLKTGLPRADLQIGVYTEQSTTAEYTGTTDASGLVTFPVDPGKIRITNYNVVATSTDGAILGFDNVNWADGLSPYEFGASYDVSRSMEVYAYTDQSVYRPDRPVYYRAIIRDRDDVKYTVPGNLDKVVTITDPNGQQIYEKRFEDAAPSLNGQYQLPPTLPLGNYTINVSLQPYTSGTAGKVYQTDQFVSGSVSFQVAEYRPPEFLVTATAEAAEANNGDTIRVTVDGKFLFGGAVSGATVNWTASANPAYFNYTGDGNYQFGDNPPWWFFYGGDYGSEYSYGGRGSGGNNIVASGSGTLDTNGQFIIEVPADLQGSANPKNFTIEASVTDLTNQTVAGRTTVLVHPATVYIGVQAESYVAKQGSPTRYNVIAVDPASKAIPNQTIKADIARRTYEQNPTTLQYEEKLTIVDSQTLTTDTDGKAVLTFTPADAGSYDVTLTARDSRERIAKTTTTLYVQGPNAGDPNPNSRTLTLVTDKQNYVTGDTAQILIASPFPETVKAWVTVERAGIMKTEVIDVQGSVTYTLPITQDYAPNVFVSVVIVRGGDGVNNNPDLRYGLAQLQVKTDRQLTVKLTPSATLAEPGKAIRFDVLTTAANGEPVSAEVGLSLTDVATLSVGSPNSTPIFDYFWSPRGLSVITTGSWVKAIDDLKSENISVYGALRADAVSAAAPSPAATNGAYGGAVAQEGAADSAVASDSERRAKGDDKSGAVVAPRSNFVDTPLWKPDLVTGADGRGSVEVTLPDNLTTWRLDARAATLDTQVGDATLEFVSTRPLIVRPATPRFFIVGDQVELATVVNNNTDQDLQTEVALTAKGATLDTTTSATQTVMIKAKDRTRVTWQATIDDVSNVDLVFSAKSGDFADASKPAVGLGDNRLLPVYRYLAPDYVATAGVLRQPGSRTEGVLVPNVDLAPSGNLTIRIQPSLAAVTLDGLDYLKNYQYQCIEQTVSRFLPNILNYRALQAFGINKPELQSNLQTAIKFALDKLLAEQRPDGGWGYYYQDRTDSLTTAWAVFGLLEARKADSLTEPYAAMLDRAVAYLIANAPNVDQPNLGYSNAWELNRAAFVQYVLSMAGSPNMRVVDALYARRAELSLYARAYLIQIYAPQNNAESKTKVDTLTSDLLSAAITSATGTHWEEDYRDWWNWGSDTRSTAIILDALIVARPDSDLLPNIVRWLIVARKATAWETTQETAWAIMALTRWMQTTGELKAAYDFTVDVNDKSIGTGTASSANLTETTTLTAQVTDLLRDQVNKVSLQHGAGDGSLYYTATLTLNQPVDKIKPTNRGLNFTRTYYLDGKPVTTVPVGAIVTVELEINAENDLYYVNIDDPIPAGTEILNRNLQTTAQVGQAPELTRANDDYFRYGWGWWWFSNTEIRTEKIVLSATYLPRGAYKYVYQIEATTPGAYRVIPSNGQEFYFPEVFGRGAGSLFTVTGK